MYTIDDIADLLRTTVETRGPVDVGKSGRGDSGISPIKLHLAIKKLEDEGFKVYYLPFKSKGLGNLTVAVKVLTKSDVSFKEAMESVGKVSNLATEFAELRQEKST